jgi:subtilisin family serine protease
VETKLNQHQNTDENGHGSHVAGTIGGATYGVAKRVNLVAVKVLGADGPGTNSGVISGLNFGTSLIFLGMN